MGFGLCFDYLRNIQKFQWNHKRVLRVYREGLCVDIDFSLPTEKVIRSLERVIEWRGKPAAIRYDNDPEYISQKLIDWANSKNVINLEKR
ncbi:hypothetical protein GCM10007162_14590 [Ignatzschineria ureiclastica]|nr:hypothetical protein GCM10007162_14590 [Ignatzschineria ureiclastica]